ncbi:MAG TPA: glycosyltransferase, partial [Rudaea sp.]|nr:glycosyltransferase [Rudaea sp.]
MTRTKHNATKPSLWRALLLSLLVAGLNFALWKQLNPPTQPPNWAGKMGGFAYAPYQRYQDPNKGIYPTLGEVDNDIKLLSRHSDRLRTYAALENPAIPAIAKKYGMQVMAGAWLDHRDQHNEDEIAALVDSVRKNDNIKRVIVGNEVLLRNDMGVTSLIGYIDRVRAQVKVPVSTAEPWHIWLKYPQLAQHVDFITVHLLPYWEGYPRKDAIGLQVLMRYYQLQSAFPGKHIVIGEVGWPSSGDRIKGANASIADEALFIRQWLNVARQRNFDYYLMEAFDQPWKEAFEHRVGAYWGIYGADRQPKFSMTGTVIEDPSWPWKAAISCLIGLLPMFWFARHFIRFKTTGLIFYCVLIQLSASLLVWLATLPYAFYLDPVDWTMLSILAPAQFAIVLIALINGFEFTEVLWRRRWLREFNLLTPTPGDPQPFVSIHLACCNEPPEMVNLTLDSLAALDYENFEVVVIDNNTRRDEVWKPVEEHCAKLGSRFRFFHLNPWPGFKAGALNFGLKQTDPRAD